jgi:NADH-quinone oxidoreductase subunit J
MLETIKNIDIQNIVFGLFFAVTLGGALYVLFSKNVLFAAYGLLVSLLSVAGIFVFGGAEFVAAAQIMIYIGGILVLLIFGIMLSSQKTKDKDHLKIENSDIWLTILLVFLLSFLVIFLVSSLIFDTHNLKPEQHIKNMGFNLMTDSVLALELVGVLLLMALIGATYIAKKDE